MFTNKWLATALSCTAFALAACGGGQNGGTTASTPASTPAQAASDSGIKILRVATNAEFAPFESQDENKNIKGFDIDLLNAMGEVGGFKPEFRHQPWDSLAPALANGDVDAIAAAVTITDERKTTMDFTQPYYKVTQVVLVAPNKDVKDVEDLKKLTKVGVVSGNTGDLAAQKIFGPTSQTIARFETAPLMIKEVENGGVDAAISDSAVIANYVKNNPDKGFKMVEIPDFTEENYGIAVRKGNTETLNMLNDALAKVRENGKYAEIEAKYFAK